MDRHSMSSASSLYQSVINDVISNVRESFLDEGVDENVLIELKNLWQQKLEASKAVDNTAHHNDTSVLDSKMNSMRRSGGNSGGGGGNMAGGQSSSGGAAAAPGQVVIADPNRLVPVQITIPAQANNPNSQPRALTVQVPAHALQPKSNSGTTLQTVLTSAITTALSYPQGEAAKFLQNEINIAFRLS
jgi:transcription initiation factor TFIIA large subunit